MTLETLIQTHGLPGIALGVVIEGDGVAFLGGVLAHRGFFPLWQAILAATLGAILVDNLFFLLGRRAGQGAFARRLLARGPVVFLAERLDRHPVAAILGFRFLYGLKSAGAVLIGTRRIPWPRFAMLDALACLIWAGCATLIGHASGHLIGLFLGPLRLHWHLALAGMLCLAALFLLHRWQRRRLARHGR